LQDFDYDPKLSNMSFHSSNKEEKGPEQEKKGEEGDGVSSIRRSI
jgi:hypothetical protein